MNQKIEFDKECIVESFEERQTQSRKFYCKINVLDCDGKRKQFNYFDYVPLKDSVVFQQSYNQVFNFVGVLNPDGFNVVNNIIHVPAPKTNFQQIQNKLFNKNVEFKKLVSFLKENIIKDKYKKLIFSFLSDKKFLKCFLSSPFSECITYRGSVLQYLNYSFRIIKQNLNMFEQDFIINTDAIYCAFFISYVSHIKNINIIDNKFTCSKYAQILGKKTFKFSGMKDIETYPHIHGMLLQFFSDAYQSTVEGRIFKKMYWLSNQMFILKYFIDNCEKIDDVVNIQLKNQSFDLIYPSTAWLLTDANNN